MNDEYRELDRRSVNNSRDSLVERLDPALGEASSGIGVLLSELVRRTLRGGVSKIEEEMHEFVEEKVDLVVADRMPAFQEAATRTAELKAEEISRREVAAVERQARESAERLAQEMAETEHRGEEQRKRLAEEVQAASQRLSGELAETERRVEDKARVITREAVEVVEQETKATAEKLTTDIAETERRAEERARELVAHHVEELKQKSKSTYLQVRECLDELNSRAGAFEERIVQEQQARNESLNRLQQTLDSTLQRHLEELTGLVKQLRSDHAALEARIIELERPRGLRKLWRRFFGGKQKSRTAAQATPRNEPTIEA